MKVIPGEAVATSVAKIGEHASGVVSANAQRKAEDSSANRIVAETDPSAWAEGERQKTRRTLGKVAIITGGILISTSAVVGGGIYAFHEATSAINNLADSLAPEPMAAVSGEVAITHVYLPKSITLGAADGKATFKIKSQNHISKFGIPGTGFEIPVSVTGTATAEINDAPANVELSIITTEDGEEHLKVGVVASSVISNLNNQWVDPTMNADNGFLTQISGDDGQTRAEWAINYANSQLQQCKENLKPAIVPGTQAFFKGMLLSTSEALAVKDPGAAAELEKLANSEIIVEFTIPNRSGADSIITVDGLRLAGQTKEVSTDQLAEALNVDMEDITVSESTCKATPSAMTDILEMNGITLGKA